MFPSLSRRNNKSRETNGECDHYNEMVVAPRRTPRLQQEAPPPNDLHQSALEPTKHGLKGRESRRSSRHHSKTSAAAEKEPKNNNHLKDLKGEDPGRTRWNQENRYKQQQQEGSCKKREYEAHAILEPRGVKGEGEQHRHHHHHHHHHSCHHYHGCNSYDKPLIITYSSSSTTITTTTITTFIFTTFTFFRPLATVTSG